MPWKATLSSWKSFRGGRKGKKNLNAGSEIGEGNVNGVTWRRESIENAPKGQRRTSIIAEGGKNCTGKEVKETGEISAA